jgi:hypothetical protein
MGLFAAAYQATRLLHIAEERLASRVGLSQSHHQRNEGIHMTRIPLSGNIDAEAEMRAT